MKKLLCALLALCLFTGAALAEDIVSADVEAQVPEAWTAGEGSGLWVEGEGAPLEGDFTAWDAEDDAPGVSAAAGDDDVVALGPDEYVDAPEVALDKSTWAQPDGGEPTRAEVNAGVVIDFPGVQIDIPMGDGDQGPDALFAAYTRNIFYPDRKSPPLATYNAGRELKGMERVIYNRLKQAVIDIAAGNRASTVVQIPIVELVGKNTFTFAELGVQPVYNEYGWPTDQSFQSMYDAFFALLKWDYTLVTEALWLDCSYELYWYDRYQNGIFSTGPSCQAVYDEALGDYVLVALDDYYTFRLPVVSQYAGSAPYTVNTGTIAVAKQAAANARAIVSRYANCSDFAKLYGYVFEICRLVDYNHPAAASSWDLSEQNPWKLIWVFDNDPDTKVVCEGYAIAFQYLCELTSFDSGVRSLLVNGNASVNGDGGDHAWNVVRMDDGRNYVVDVTWIDDSWVNNLTGSMADWISNGKGQSLFLAGGTGSVSGAYTVDMGYADTVRTYSEAIRNAYPASALALAPSRYVPQGFMRIDGATYYFEDGSYVTGTRTIDGATYDFGTNGMLTAAWTPGWHTIGGKRYYFDANGLHTQHTAQVLPAVAPTCEKSGLSVGKRCSVCGATLVPQETEPALGHAWSVPTYALTGDRASMTAERVCVHDAAHVQSETVAATATLVEAPTCTGMGTATYTARFTNRIFGTHSLTLTNVPAAGHSPVIDAAVAATYTSTGLTEGSHCKVCGQVLTPQLVVAKKPRTSLARAVVTAGNKTWTGKALTTTVTVTLNGKLLKEGKHYTVSYSNNTDIGTATVTVKGVNKYKKTASATFKIKPKKVKDLQLKAGSKKLTASWKKVSGASGYQLQYATSTKKLSTAAKITVKGSKTLKYVIKKLKAKKTYYVRVRSYKTVNGKKYYSSWSTAIKKKTK